MKQKRVTKRSYPFKSGTQTLAEVLGQTFGAVYNYFDATNVNVLTAQGERLHWAMHLSWALDGPGWWTHEADSLAEMEAWLAETFDGLGSTPHIRALTYLPQNWRTHP